MAAHVDETLGERTPQLEVVRGRDRVTERALHLLFCFQRSCDRRLHVADVIERVKDSKHIDTAFGRMLDEEFHDVVREVALRDEVLASDQGLDRGIRRHLVELAQVLPRVFVDAELGLERRPSEGFHGGKADRVHLGGDRQDLLGPQVAAQERLLGVAKGGIDQADPRFLLGH